METDIDALKKGIVDLVGAHNVYANEPMREHTSIKAGGPASLLVLPETSEKLAGTIREANKIPFLVMGNGTNLLVGDDGFKGIVIKTLKLASVEVCGDMVRAEAGALLSGVSRVAYAHGLSGLEFAEGIPGTIGGAVAMNAGAYGGEMKDVIIGATVCDMAGNIFSLDSDELELGYRSSVFGKGFLTCLSVEMMLKGCDKMLIKERMDANRRLRIEKQPVSVPSAGSTFKRPEGYFAGKLISDSGLKGYRIGGASVSEKHCGFVINDGNAPASDILELIRYIQRTVLDKFGVMLQPEVKIVGDWPENTK